MFTKNPNLALYIYDTSLERDCIRKITEPQKIQDYLDFIAKKMQNYRLLYEHHQDREEIKNRNQALDPLNNKILATTLVEAEISPAPAPKTKSPQQQVEEEFKEFHNKLDTKEKVVTFLKFLWGGGSDNDEYDAIKNKLTETLKDKYTGNEARQKQEAAKFINGENRERAIARLEELNKAEVDEAKQQRTTKFIATYHQIYRQHKLDTFLEQDEFELGKFEMQIFFKEEKKSKRVQAIDELEEFLNKSTINDSQILDFLKFVNNDVGVDDKDSLKTMWKKHEDSLFLFKKEDTKKVARRDFLLLAIEAMESQENKQILQDFVKTNYKEEDFLTKFSDQANKINLPSPSPLHDTQPPSPLQENNMITPIVAGALIGVGAGLCVSALTVGIVFSAPSVITVVAVTALGVGVGFLAGTIIEKAQASQLATEVVNNPALN